MSIATIRQLNSGNGLKLKSDFKTKTIAKNISTNRPGVADLVSGNYSALNSNIIFTKSNPIGRGSKYLNSGQISRMVNSSGVQRTWIDPSLSGYSYNQGFNVNTGSVSMGSAIGMLLGMAPMIKQSLSNAGIIKSKGDNLLDQTDISNTNVTGGSLATSLTSATSFTEITKIETEIAQKKTNLNENYQKIGTDAKKGVDEILQGEGVKDGFTLAGVELDTSSLQLSPLDPDYLEESMQTIDSDIKKFGDFNTLTLPQAKTKITAKSGQITGELNAKTVDLERLKASNKNGVNDAAIAKLEEEIKTLEEQKKQLEAAEKAIEQITKECESAIKDLEARKTEIADIKKAEDNMKDKKYDLAKSQDNELKKSMTEIDKINQEIEKLSIDKNPDKYDKSDEKRAAKMNSLMSQRSSLYSQLGKLAGSLSGAGATEFENSKHQKYTIQNLDKAMDMISSKPAEAQQKEKEENA